MRDFGRRAILVGGAVGLLAISQAAIAEERRPDVADTVTGTWLGDVISDSQGSGRQGVTLTIARISRDTVQISSDYERLPVTTITLERAMTAIVNRTGDSAFSYEARTGQLNVSFHNEVSWSGRKAG